MAEIGVILLMFGVGLHFHFKELLAVKRIAIPGALGQSAVATIVSMVVLLAFGWSWGEGAVFGMAIAVASTVVLTRILADSGPVGKTVYRLLRDNGFSPSVVEMNLDTVKELRAQGVIAFFGDASHPDTLTAAGITRADILILRSSSIPSGEEIIQEAKRMNPKIRVIARTGYLREANELINAGATAVFSGEGEVALSITEKILEAFGATREQIDRERDRFRQDFANPEERPLEI